MSQLTAPANLTSAFLHSLGQKPTCRPWIVMSAMQRIADSDRASRHVRNVPTASVRLAKVINEKPPSGGFQFKPDDYVPTAINAGLACDGA